jgi:cation transport regulator ChaB
MSWRSSQPRVDTTRIARTPMPKTTKGGEPKKNELPSTLRRSGAKAQRTFAKAHDAGAEQYGSEERAHRVAYAALKHSFEKVGDHWERKRRKGPSDARAERGGLHNPIPSAEGVDANASKRHLLEIARRLDVRGRSTMDKSELVDAIKKHNRRARGR